jgi:Ca-activated chloride channel family protein
MTLPHFQNPWALALLLLLPLLAWDYFRRNEKRRASIRFPSLSVVKRMPASVAYRLRHVLVFLRLGAVALLAVALARPQLGESLEEVSTQGVDIVLVLDVSSSMKTMDFKPKNRLHVAKKVIEEFILGRQHDRIGLVVFSGRSFTQCPLTLDYNVLVQLLRKVEFGQVEDGTAIGTAVLNGTNRLRGSGAKSKVIVLLTDGENNAGEVDPVTAARAAKALGVKIYTIGVGKEGEQPLEVEDPFFGKRIVAVPTRIDEPMLREIAGLTGAKYYRAQDPKALEDIYKTIDELEKTEIKTSSYTRYREVFSLLAWAALGLILAEVLLAHTRFRKVP